MNNISNEFIKTFFGGNVKLGQVTFKTDNMQPCIDACVKCAQACWESFSLCLEEPDVESRKNCISLLVQCAGTCQCSAAIMSMSGSISKVFSQMCAQICLACAEECSKYEDDYTQICADICTRCAEECSIMIADGK